MPPPSQWPALITLPPPRQVSARLAPPVMLCCFPPASSSTPLRQSVHYPSITLVVNIRYISIFCNRLKLLHIFDQTCIVLKSDWNSAARVPRLVRRADTIFLPRPCLALYFLSFLLRHICLASSFLHCLTSSALPRFHLPSLPPHRPSSIFALHAGGSGRVAKQAARTSFSFDLSIICPLVSYAMCVNHCLEKVQVKNIRRVFSLDLCIRRLKPSKYFIK